MNVYVVLSQAKEENKQGDVLSIDIRFYGVFSDKKYAEGIARKYNANIVTSLLNSELFLQKIGDWHEEKR